MNKQLFYLIIFLPLYTTAQRGHPDPNKVINKNHVVISGRALIVPGSTVYYTADFFYPNETGHIEWGAVNGTVLSYNTDPNNGPIHAYIQWDGNRPGSPGETFGTVYLTRRSLGNGFYYEGGMLNVNSTTFEVNTSCQVFPDMQFVNYQQQPCMLTGFTDCSGLGYINLYQWYDYDPNSSTSNPVPGATNYFFQPPALTSDLGYYRNVDIYDHSYNFVGSFSSRTVNIHINPLNPGTLYNDDPQNPQGPVGVSYGTNPVIIDEMPFGGAYTSGQYNLEWQMSISGRPWVSLGNSLHFPGVPGGITKQSIKIRRILIYGRNGVLSTNELEFYALYQDIVTEPDKNYIKENTIRVKGIESVMEADNLKTTEKLQTTLYFDGLDRGIQKVASGAALFDNLEWGDIVLPISYDAAGRTSKKFLPYATLGEAGLYKTAAETEQSAYYQLNYNESPSFGQTVFENNPLNRIKVTKAPGTSWANNQGNSLSYDVNTASDPIRIWDIGYGINDYPTTSGTYPTNTLTKTIYLDDQGKKTIVFTDRGGKEILRKVQVANTVNDYLYNGWSCTYSVYDDFGRLRFSLTPKAIEYLDNNSWSFNSIAGQKVINELCFKFFYDRKGQMVYKKSPGSGETVFVYDTKGRLVLTQDDNERQGKFSQGNPQWSFVLYDESNRIVATGINTYASPISQASMQAYVRGLTTSNQNILVSLGGGHQENIVANNPVAGSSAACNNCVSTQFNAISYYDHYNYPNAKPFNTSYTLQFSSSIDPNIEPTVFTYRLNGVVTGSKNRVLGSNGTVLNNTVYYDEYGRVLQTLTDNIKGGEDIVTNQYNFNGETVSVCNKHTAPGTSYANFAVLTKMSYDKIGRITKLSKKFGDLPNRSFQDFVDVASYAYDELGRLKSKKIGITSLDESSYVEKLDYSYNLHGTLKGINKDYALKTPGSYSKWNNYFGIYLDYDNRDGHFQNSVLNGNLTGVLWSTQGDDAQRKFDFSYDNLNQLLEARFTEKDVNSGNWTNAKYDFTATMTYGINGGLATMSQKGVVPGMTPQTIDDLVYFYKDNGYSNQLLNVQDNTAGSSFDGKLGDFKDGTNNAGSDDYIYDGNGNLLMDLNKEIKNIASGSSDGIKYNYLDKVDEVKIAGKGKVKFVYDARGNKLQKIFYPDNTSLQPIETSYINDCIYQGNELQFVNFEEGRVRVVTKKNEVVGASPYLEINSINGNLFLSASNSGPYIVKEGALDYFIKDHLGNTRMVLTEEQQVGKNTCSMEPTRAAAEEPYFGQVDHTGNPNPVPNEVRLTRTHRNNISAWTQGLQGDYVSALSGMANFKKVGPNAILKVMAGDKLSAGTHYYYASDLPYVPPSTILNDVVIGLLGAFNSGGVATLAKNHSAQVGANLNNINGNLSSFISTQPANGANLNAPLAFLNILFFDENFNFISDGSQFKRVWDPGDNADPLELIHVKAPKNGYAFVYLSNETDTRIVFFDNFWVQHERGRIVEESHYYPFGLRMVGISSTKSGSTANGVLHNRYGYQGSSSEEEEHTGWMEFDLRNYDPQIGRWTQIDPYVEFPDLYIGMGNNPANFADPSGGNLFVGFTLAERVLVGASFGAVLGGIIGSENDETVKGMITGAALGAMGAYLFSAPLRPNFLVLPSMSAVVSEFKNKQFESAYTGGRVKAIFMEIVTLGKIVVVSGNTRADIDLKIKKYFDKHPLAQKVGNLLEDFHAGEYGDNDVMDTKILDGVAKYFDKQSTVLLGNCWQASSTDVATVSKNLNDAKVVASHALQNDLGLLFKGTLSGTNPLSMELFDKFSEDVGDDIEESENLYHDVAHNNQPKAKVPSSVKVTWFGEIKVQTMTEAERTSIIEGWKKEAEWINKAKTKFSKTVRKALFFISEFVY